jgi:hypothetical protein
MALRALSLFAVIGAALGQSRGDVASVYELLERVIPGSSDHFNLSFVTSCSGVAAGTACFTMKDAPAGTVAIAGTTAAELTAGLGVYVRFGSRATFLHTVTATS